MVALRPEAALRRRGDRRRSPRGRSGSWSRPSGRTPLLGSLVRGRDLALPEEERQRLLVSLPPPDVVAALLGQGCVGRGRCAGMACRTRAPFCSTDRLTSPRCKGKRSEWILKPRSSQRFRRVFGHKGLSRPEPRRSRIASLPPAPRPGRRWCCRSTFPDPQRPRAHRRHRRRGQPSRAAGTPPRKHVPTRARGQRIRCLHLARRGRGAAEELGRAARAAPVSRDRERRVQARPARRKAQVAGGELPPFLHVELGRRWGTNLCLMAYCDALDLPMPAANRRAGGCALLICRYGGAGTRGELPARRALCPRPARSARRHGESARPP